ncbi:uncharacterized protein [Penaeus vannamei]|uniref:uncharacterized protein isoform X1 n=2 Tax=Penaeus vannamei TaxID=6689 RepID=UPI00387F924E
MIRVRCPPYGGLSDMRMYNSFPDYCLRLAVVPLPNQHVGRTVTSSPPKTGWELFLSTVGDGANEDTQHEKFHQEKTAMAYYRDSERLIHEMSKRPLLWDSTAEAYSHKAGKAEAWASVYRALYDDYGDKSKAEQSNLGKEIQARWKSIRDSYIKDCRKVRSEAATGAPPSRRYIFFEQLSFLNKVIGRKAASGGLPSPPSPDATEDAPQKALNGDSSSEPSVKKKRRQGLDPEAGCPSEDRLQCQLQQPDDDRDFFMSMLPAVRTLSEDQKLSFRIHILQTLQRIKAGQSLHSAGVSKPDI